jgi:hypothetical protein
MPATSFVALPRNMSVDLAAAVDQHHVPRPQRAWLLGPVREGRVGAEQDERAAAHSPLAVRLRCVMPALSRRFPRASYGPRQLLLRQAPSRHRITTLVAE